MMLGKSFFFVELLLDDESELAEVLWLSSEEDCESAVLLSFLLSP